MDMPQFCFDYLPLPGPPQALFSEIREMRQWLGQIWDVMETTFSKGFGGNCYSSEPGRLQDLKLGREVSSLSDCYENRDSEVLVQYNFFLVRMFSNIPPQAISS